MNATTEQELLLKLLLQACPVGTCMYTCFTMSMNKHQERQGNQGSQGGQGLQASQGSQGSQGSQRSQGSHGLSTGLKGVDLALKDLSWRLINSIHPYVF